MLTTVDLVTLLGNMVVFICPALEKRLRTVTYMFILSLATADLLVACLVMPFRIQNRISKFADDTKLGGVANSDEGTNCLQQDLEDLIVGAMIKMSADDTKIGHVLSHEDVSCNLHIIYEVTGIWMFGRLFCKVWISFDVMFCTASIVTLCFISLDRYCSVATPYHYPKRMSRGRCIAMTITIWVYSSMISFLPVMQGWNEIPGVDVDSNRECVFVTNRTFAIVASALAFYIPFLIMCTMYFFIYRASRLKAVRIMSQALDLHYHPDSRRQDNLQLEHKATRTMSIIISVFVLCWLPYFVFNISIAVHGSQLNSTTINCVFKVITWFGYCNSTINPLLYAFLNRDFQRALKKMLVCRRWRVQVDVGDDMVSIVTFTKTVQGAESSAKSIDSCQ
ncbi:histamine H2 receptor-like [Heterodontus francisci]|uniref:histamine H2 receptor-like n=1 Tax=Heterodontus francisci TaxID=7792 RepID=UPI00355BB0DB